MKKIGYVLVATLLLASACGEPCQEQACEAGGSCEEYHVMLCGCCPSPDDAVACSTAVVAGCSDGTLRVCQDEASCAAEIDNWNTAYQQGIAPCDQADPSEVAEYCESAASQ